MGSGALLAILVGLWFVVLVPMVVTRGELASPASPARVLRRRSSAGSDSSRRSAGPETHRPTAGPVRDRSEMSATSRLGASPATAPRADAALPNAALENLVTEPVPVVSSDQPAAAGAKNGQSTPAAPAETDQSRPQRRPSRPPSGTERVVRVDARPPVPPPAPPAAGTNLDIRARRRRLLSGLIGLAVLWAAFAAFWQPLLWWPQIVLDLVVFSYLVFLRLEAQREQDREERRRARSTMRAPLPVDRTERVAAQRAGYEAALHSTSTSMAIELDDDDPNFRDMPTWAPPAPATVGVAARSRASVAHDQDEAEDWSYRKAV